MTDTSDERKRLRAKETTDVKATPKQELARLEAIRERDAARHLPDYDVEKAKELEDFEIEHSPEAFRQRHSEHGLDELTERKLEASERKRQDSSSSEADEVADGISEETKREFRKRARED